MKTIELIKFLLDILDKNPDLKDIMISPTEGYDLVLYDKDVSHDLNWEYFNLKENSYER